MKHKQSIHKYINECMIKIDESRMFIELRKRFTYLKLADNHVLIELWTPTSRDHSYILLEHLELWLCLKGKIWLTAFSYTNIQLQTACYILEHWGRAYLIPAFGQKKRKRVIVLVKGRHAHRVEVETDSHIDFLCGTRFARPIKKYISQHYVTSTHFFSVCQWVLYWLCKQV